MNGTIITKFDYDDTNEIETQEDNDFVTDQFIMNQKKNWIRMMEMRIRYFCEGRTEKKKMMIFF